MRSPYTRLGCDDPDRPQDQEPGFYIEINGDTLLANIVCDKRETIQRRGLLNLKFELRFSFSQIIHLSKGTRGDDDV